MAIVLVWSSRSSAYKLGVVGLVVSALFYILGFALPFWVKTDSRHSGLWLGCSAGSPSYCTSTVNDENPGWIKAWQAMECLGLIGLVIAEHYTLIANCRQVALPHSRLLEILSVFSGACGFIGCMIFVGKIQGIDDTSSKFYSWSFGLNLTGSVLLVVFAAVIGIGNRSDLAAAGAGGTPAMQGMVVQQGAAYQVQSGVQPVYGYNQGVPVTAAQYSAGVQPPQAGYASPAYGGNN